MDQIKTEPLPPPKIIDKKTLISKKDVPNLKRTELQAKTNESQMHSQNLEESTQPKSGFIGKHSESDFVKGKLLSKDKKEILQRQRDLVRKRFSTAA